MKADPAGRLLGFSAYLLAFFAPVSIAVAQGAAGLILVGALICVVSGSRASRIPVWVGIILPSYLVVVFLSSVLAPDFASALPGFRKLWVLLCLYPLAAYSDVYSNRRLAEFLVLGTSVASILGLYRYLTGAVARAAPFSGGYTTLALFEAAVLSLAVGLLASDRSFKRWIYALAIPILAAGLFCTGTRAGWAAAVAGLLVIGYFSNKRLTLAALLGTGALLAAIPQSRDMIGDRFKADKKGGITSGRTILYRAAVEPLSKLPFWGYGPGSFKRLVPDDVLESIGDRGVASWHSTPMEILIESGPAAAVSLLGLFTLPILTRRGHRNEQDRLGIFRVAYKSALLALYLAGLTTNLMRDFMLLSLLVVIWSMSFSGAAEAVRAGNKSRPLLLDL